MKFKFISLIVILLGSVCSIKAETNPYIYAGAGAAIGGVVGNQVGSKSGNRSTGTAIGVVVGGLAGNVYGQRVLEKERKEKLEAQQAAQRIEQQRIENARLERQRADDDLVSRGRSLNDSQVKEAQNRAQVVQREKFERERERMRARQRAIDYDQAQRDLANRN